MDLFRDEASYGQISRIPCKSVSFMENVLYFEKKTTISDSRLNIIQTLGQPLSSKILKITKIHSIVSYAHSKRYSNCLPVSIISKIFSTKFIARHSRKKRDVSPITSIIQFSRGTMAFSPTLCTHR